ncbi:MAG TPA: T9SS type A sorting domain-containing protein [Chitinophagaceae bacterium]|nr:T9SS type A sorting domain-containing protein [Chitinophagaceae bacterium]
MKKFFLPFAIAANLILGTAVFGQQIAKRGATTTDITILANVLTLNTPTGVQAGDVMFVNIIQTRSTDGPALANATNANWIVITGSDVGSANDTRTRSTILYRIATGSEPASYNFALDVNTNSASGGLIAFYNVALTGVTHTGAPGGPFVVTPGSISTSGGSQNDDISCSGINGLPVGAAVIMLAHCRDNSTFTDASWTTTDPALTEILDISNGDNDGTTVGAAWARKLSAGNTGNGIADLSSNELWGAMLIALKPLPSGPVGCNGQCYISHGPVSGFTGNTLMEKLGFSGLSLTPQSYQLAPGGIGFNALGINPIDGYIYAIRYPATGEKSHLLRIDNSGNQTDLGAIPALNDDEIVYAGCFDVAGAYYFLTQDDRFMKINNPVTSLTASVIASNAAYSTIYDIAIHPTTGQMYATSSSITTNYLFTIDKATGTISGGVGPTMNSAGFFAGLFFDESGNLFGYRGDGGFFLINKTTGILTAAGSSVPYDGADGCNCSFGRVFHDLDFTQNPNNQVCATAGNPQPAFPLTVTVTNQTGAQQFGLTYTLNMVDPMKRFKFTESTVTIKNNLIAAGFATVASTVTLSAVLPATGTNYNKLVVTGFQTGAANSVKSFTFQVQLVGLGGDYVPVPLQSEITGLVAPFGPNDLSNDPTSVTPDDATVIIFCPNIVLPARLLSFTGTYKNNVTLLDWVAENQVNTAFYEIERSSDGSNFSSIGNKASQGTPSSRENYQYTDNLLSAPGNVFYYRLKMVDIDGAFKYSNVVMIQRNEKTLTGISLSPNPVVGADATARISATAKGTVDLSVVDMAGRVVLSQQNKVSEGVNSIAIRNIERLQPGVYLLKMNNEGTIVMTKFAVVR